jgi:uncharacterized lipoprotein YehR (DUF1307 family)
MQMKTTIAAATILLFSLGACAERTESHTTVGDTTTVHRSTTTETVDTRAAEDAARDATEATGTALEEAGQELQEQARPNP